MSSQKYIKEFKSKLDCIESKTKNEIVKEIESLITQNDDYLSLEKRLGSPSDLANTYLEDIPKIKPIKKRIYTGLQKTLAIITLIIISIIIIASIFISNFIDDPYDYSSYTSNSINSKIETPWVKIDNVKNIKIQQSKVIFYASTENELSYSCTKEVEYKNLNNDIVNKNNSFNDISISQSRCIIKLPNNIVNLNINQSSVYLIEPINEIRIDSEQSEIKLAQKKSIYNFKVNIKSSDFKDLISNENGIKIDAKLFQSSFGKYEY